MTKLEDRPWWPELVALKDVLSLRELSELFGAAPAAISNALKRNDLSRSAAPPGPRSRRDPALKQAAAEALAELGDPAPVRAAPEGSQPRGRLAPYRHLVGKLIDREVAELAGVSVSAVTNYRRRHDIPAAAASSKANGGGDEAPSGEINGSRRPVLLDGRAFRVTIGDHDFVVVAPDIVAAARIATESNRGEVIRVELLGGAIAA